MIFNSNYVFNPVPTGQKSTQALPSKYTAVPGGHLSTQIEFLTNNNLNSGEAEQLGTHLSVIIGS